MVDREKINEERLDILCDFRATDEEEKEDHDRRMRDLKERRLLTAQEDIAGKGFKKRWWKFDKEWDGKIPILRRWVYVRFTGTGQPIAAGATISLGWSWGAAVINLPMFELTLGYVPSPMTL